MKKLNFKYLKQLTTTMAKTMDFSFYPFRFHCLGHKVIYMHGSHPLANGGTGFGNLGDRGWLELLIIYVGLD